MPTAGLKATTRTRSACCCGSRCEDDAMNLRSQPSLIAACLCAWLACGTAAADDFIDLRDVGPVQGNAEAVRDRIELCSACHGPEGVSPVPIFPSISGLPAEYLYWQLVEIKREARPESPMTALVLALTDQDMRDYAAWYAALPLPAPVAVEGGESERGAALFREGNPATGVPPGQGGHGAAAGGHPLASTDLRYRLYPPLRGQHAAYVAERLKHFREGKYMMTSND